jgi:hypothetical protein
VASRNRWNITGFGMPEKSHSAYPCEVEGGSSLAEPWYDSSLVVTMRFQTANRWWPERSSYAATSVLTEEAYAAAALCIPWGPLLHRWVRRFVSRRTWLGVAPYVPGASAGLSTGSVEASRCSQQLLGWVSGRQ